MRSSVVFALLAALVAVAFAADSVRNTHHVAYASLVDARRALTTSLNSLTQMESASPELQKQLKLVEDAVHLVKTAGRQKSKDYIYGDVERASFHNKYDNRADDHVPARHYPGRELKWEY
uniref:RxLR effector protein n=1 Tax=Steinernema glaseri TaxID=37863 RepID=A0A1I8AH34_9BILA